MSADATTTSTKGGCPIRLHPRLTAAAIALFLVCCGAWQLAAGEARAPAPLREVGIALFAWSPSTAARAIVAVEFALAAAVLAAGTRVMNLLAAGAAAFAALACVSRALSPASGDDAGILMPLLALAFAAGLIFLAMHATVADAGAARMRRIGLSPAWSALAALAAATASAHFTAEMSFRDPNAAPAPAPPPAGTPAQASATPIDLDMRPFEGARFADTPLAKYMPALVERTRDRDAYIVVYSPSCGTCRTLFIDNFLVPLDDAVLAVAIPPAEGAVVAAGDGEAPIECYDCEMLSLPAGPLWLVAQPMVLKIENGKVACVSDRFGGNCLPGSSE
jgi:hypothetical protein